MRNTALALLVIFFMAASCTHAAAADKLKIGVVLHSYYSWVSNIVGDRAEVVTVIPPDADPHSYQPRAEDLVALKGIDVIVVNGLGHDTFIFPMLESAGRQDIKIIKPNEGLPLIPVFEQTYTFEDGKAQITEKVAYNSHSYIALTGAVQQINTITRELAAIDPPNADTYRQNARAYNRRLRNMLANALTTINRVDTSRFTMATVHDGYAYLFQELGLDVSAVVQPRHGIEPSPRQLADTIDQIKKANVNILFTEMDFDKKYVDIIFKETGCRIYSLSHVSNGPFSAEKFETDMQKNLDTIVRALTEK